MDIRRTANKPQNCTDIICVSKVFPTSQICVSGNIVWQRYSNLLLRQSKKTYRNRRNMFEEKMRTNSAPLRKTIPNRLLKSGKDGRRATSATLAER